MSRYCPVAERKVLYTECLECDEKECRTDKTMKQRVKMEQRENNSEKQEAVQDSKKM